METRHAPAERSDRKAINRQADIISKIPFLQEIQDADPIPVVILNENRQVVFGNKSFYELIMSIDKEGVLGKRPGEIFQCIHAYETEGGCGTTENCRMCPAVNAILDSLNGVENAREADIETRNGIVLEIKIWATPFIIDECKYVFFAFLDLKNEKRRKALERIFFFDVLNKIGSIYTSAQILKQPASPSKEKYDSLIDIIYKSANSLIREIEGHRMILDAESGHLAPRPMLVNAVTLIKETADLFNTLPECREVKIKFTAGDEAINLLTDPAIFEKIITILLKTALFYSKPEEEIRITCKKQDEYTEIQIFFSEVSSTKSQLQMFLPALNEKDRSRGLENYGARLMIEKYLKGKIVFKTGSDKGSLFSILLPDLSD